MRPPRSSSCSSFVLIVDDCDYLSVPLEIALRCLDGFRVVRAFDVAGACDILSDPRVRFAAVITDLNMPVASGYELILSVRCHERYRELPVIAMSGDSGMKAKEQALRSGADAFFAKPFSINELRSTLQRLLRNSRSPI